MWKSFTQTVRRWDAYGKPITFTFKGRESYTTFLGGWVTLLAIWSTFVYLIFLINRLMDNKFVTTSVSTNYQDLYTENPLIMKDYNFSMAFGSIGIPYEILTNDRYFDLKFYQFDVFFDEEGYFLYRNFTIVDYTRCNEANVNFKNYALDNVYLKDFIWPVNMNNFIAQGVYDITNVVRYFAINLNYWKDDGSNNWAPIEDIKYYEGYYFYIDFINSYFDANDYDQPVKEYIDNTLYDYFSFDLVKEYDVFISRNNAQTKDSPLSLVGGVTDYSFVSVDNFQRYFSPDNENQLLFWGFYQSMRLESITRSTLNIIDIIGISGGFASMIIFVCGVFIRFIGRRLYYYKLISYLYQVDSSIYQNNIQPSSALSQTWESQVPSSPKKLNEESKRANYKINFSSDEKQKLEQRNSITNTYSNKRTTEKARLKRLDIINQTIASINSRRMYSYNSRDIWYHFWCCWKCMTSKSNNSLTMYNRHKLFNLGFSKALSEFDALNYAKSQRKLKILLESLMDKNERFLSEYQHI